MSETTETAKLSKEHIGNILNNILKKMMLSARLNVVISNVWATIKNKYLQQLKFIGKFKLISYSNYLSDLPPSDYALFHNLTNWFERQRFKSNEEAVDVYFEELVNLLYKNYINQWEHGDEKCSTLVATILKNKAKKIKNSY